MKPNIGPKLETERLLLRVPQLGDFERYAQMFDDPSTRHIGGPLTRAEAWRRFLQMPGAWLLQGFAMFSVVEKDSGRWIGQAGPWYPDGWPGTEVGYAFHPDAHGKGYATEACVAAIDWAFAALGWTDVIQSIAPDNTASAAVAERLGARRRGQFDHGGHVVEIWGQTREEWAESRKRFA